MLDHLIGPNLDFNSMDPDIKQKVEAAIKAGAPAQEAVARGQALQTQRTKPAQTTPPDSPQPRSSMLESVGQGALDVGKAVVQPFSQFGHLMGGMLNDITKGKVNFGQELTPAETEKMSNPLSLDNPVYRDAAGLASFAVPFGNAGFIGSKAILPGAAVGAAQTASQPNTTLPEIIGGGVAGGALGGALQGAGKLYQGLKNIGKAQAPLEKGALALEQGTRQIKQKASVYGASQEKAITQTLDKYGIKGSAQKQYEMLEPTMQRIEGDLQQVIANNPEISIPKEQIKKEFQTELKSSLRSKDMTNTQAAAEVDGYLNDLLKASGGTGKFTNIDLQKLRDLKKLVNEDYGPINDIMQRGGVLTPRQKVIAVAWSSLDNAVKTASPEVKQLLLDESNLYKSAQSLSSARANPPTMRAFGTSLPRIVTQTGTDLAAGALRKTGQAAAGISNSLPEINANPNIVGQASRIGGAVPQGQNKPNEEYNQNNPDHSDMVSQSGSNVNTIGQGMPQISTNPYPAKNYADDVARDPEHAAQYKAVYDAYQTATGGLGKPITATIKQRMDLSTAGLRAQQDAQDMFVSDPNIVLKGRASGGLASRKYDSAVSRAVEGLLRARSGAAVPKEEVEKYIRDYTPRVGDDEETALYKLAQLKLDLQDVFHNNNEILPDTTTLPPISAGY